MVSTRNCMTLSGVLIIGFVCYINVRQLQSMGQHHVIRAAATAYLPPKPYTFGAGRIADLDLDGVPDTELPAEEEADEASSTGAGLADCANDASASGALASALECAPTMVSSEPPARCMPKHVDQERAARLHVISGAWPVGCDGADADAALCAAVRAVAAQSAGGRRDLILSVASDSASHAAALPTHIAALKRAGLHERTLLVALGCRARSLAAASGLRVYAGPAATPPAGAASADLGGRSVRWRVAAALVRTGTHVLLLEPTVLLFVDPFPLFARDNDVEAMSTGWSEVEAYG